MEIFSRTRSNLAQVRNLKFFFSLGDHLFHKSNISLYFDNYIRRCLEKPDGIETTVLIFSSGVLATLYRRGPGQLPCWSAS